MKKICVLLYLILCVGYMNAQELKLFCLDDGLTLQVANTEKKSADFFESDPSIVALITGQQFSAPFGADSYYDYAFTQGSGNIFAVFQMGKDTMISGDSSDSLVALRYLLRMDRWLVCDGVIDRQAADTSANTKKYWPALRTALGTKDGKHFCFASSEGEVSIYEWANILLADGFRQAIDLSGGTTGELTSKKLIFYAVAKNNRSSGTILDK